MADVTKLRWASEFGSLPRHGDVGYVECGSDIPVRHIKAVETNGQELDFGAIGCRWVINGFGDLQISHSYSAYFL